jgi:hypothetical protein
MLDAVIDWLLHYGPWGLVMLMLFYDRWRFSTGEVVPARTVEREQQGQKELAAAVERLADGTGNIIEAQSNSRQSIDHLVVMMETVLHALQDFQQQANRR